MPLHAHVRVGLAPAEELRSLTGLPAQLLADLFGVSRTSFYKWLEGATPRDARYGHLLDVLSHVRDASARIGSVVDFEAWLRTPVSPGGKKPLDYLRDRRFTAFRGFVLQATSVEIGLAAPRPALRGALLGAEEHAAARRRIKPPSRVAEPAGDEE